MLHDIVGAKYIEDYKIEIEFDDGNSGVVDFSKYLEKGGVFGRFRDISFFRRFSVNEELGTLTWDGEIDIAPETLYAYATGTGLPEWVEYSDESSAIGIGTPIAERPSHTTTRLSSPKSGHTGHVSGDSAGQGRHK